MSEEQYHSASHCKYLTQYHIIWCPKFRFSVLQKGADDKLKNILADICNQYGYEIKALEVMPDHIHIFVDCPQTVAPCDIVRTLKSISAIEMFKAFGFKPPKYIHTPLIIKRDGDSVRKISKRKDPEAQMSYYREKGIPVKAVELYLQAAEQNVESEMLLPK